MIIELALDFIGVLLLIPVSVLFVQVFFACWPRSINGTLAQADFKTAVLVPAHNEAAGIAATLDSIRKQLKPGDRLLVVADNCTDNTAAIAIAKGAEVIERHDTQHRGKGYALAFGIACLAKNPPSIVVIIDADCNIAEHALNMLASFAACRNRPVQGLDLMLALPDAVFKTRIAEFAWIVKNRVRPRGYAKLGLPCQLMGTGMAFPWEIISRANLANGNIVEDLKLGIDLCEHGQAPIFLEDALVTSYFPGNARAQAHQRIRWEHGHLATILAEAPQLFWHAVSRLDKNLLGMAFDLCVPPLALLSAMISGYLMLAGLAWLAGASSLPMLLAWVALATLACTILLAWWGWGRHIISLFTLLLVPVYVLTKIPYYFSFLIKRQTKWVRTERK